MPNGSPVTRPCAPSSAGRGSTDRRPRPARWAASRPSGSRPRRTWRPSPTCLAPGSTGYTSAGRRTASSHAGREAGEDRRPDRAPRALCHLPAGRGGGAAGAVRRDPAPDRALARAARCGGLTRADLGAARAEGTIVRRDRPDGPKKTGSAPGPRFSGSSRPRSAGGHVLELTGDRPRSRVRVSTEPIWGISVYASYLVVAPLEEGESERPCQYQESEERHRVLEFKHPLPSFPAGLHRPG